MARPAVSASSVIRMVNDAMPSGTPDRQVGQAAPEAARVAPGAEQEGHRSAHVTVGHRRQAGFRARRWRRAHRGGRPAGRDAPRPGPRRRWTGRGRRPGCWSGASKDTKPSSALSARTSPQPRNVPMPRPMTVPTTAVITDSHRTMARSLPRLSPTARSRPSSRLRSWIESDSVLASPIRAMRMARHEQAVHEGQQLVDLTGHPLHVLVAVLHGGGAVLLDHRLDRGAALLEAGAVLQADQHGDVAGPQGVGRPVLLGHDDVAEQVADAVDGADREGALLLAGEVHGDLAAEAQVVVGGVALGHRDLAGCDRGQVALLHVEVEQGRHRRRVAGGGVLGAAVDGHRGVGERHRLGHLGQGVDLGRHRRAQPGAAEVVRGDHQVTAEALLDRLIDGAAERGAERGEQGDDGGADHQRQRGARPCGGGCAWRCAGPAGRPGRGRRPRAGPPQRPRGGR